MTDAPWTPGDEFAGAGPLVYPGLGSLASGDVELMRALSRRSPIGPTT